MVANRLDLNKGDDDKSEKAAAPAAAASVAQPAGKALKSWLPLALSLAIMPALAYAMTAFVLLPKLQKGLEPAETPAAAGNGAAPVKKKTAEGAAETTKKETVSLNKLLVNVAGTMGSRYLLASLTLVGAGSDIKAKIERYDAQLRDTACSVLSTKTIADLEKPGARNLIRSELILNFNNILGDATIQEIYFTEFAIQ